MYLKAVWNYFKYIKKVHSHDCILSLWRSTCYVNTPKSPSCNVFKYLDNLCRLVVISNETYFFPRESFWLILSCWRPQTYRTGSSYWSENGVSHTRLFLVFERLQLAWQCWCVGSLLCCLWAGRSEVVLNKHRAPWANLGRTMMFSLMTLKATSCAYNT